MYTKYVPHSSQVFHPLRGHKQDECSSHSRHWILFHSLVPLVGLWSTLAETLVHPLQAIVGCDCFINGSLAHFVPKSINPDTSPPALHFPDFQNIPAGQVGSWSLWVHSLLLSGCSLPLPGAEHLSSLLTELQLAVHLFPN